MNDTNSSPKVDNNNLKIIVRLRGGNQCKKNSDTIDSGKPPSLNSYLASKESKMRTIANVNFYNSKKRPLSKSPGVLNINKLTAMPTPNTLQSNCSYTIFTSNTRSNTVVVTDKPILGKLINSTFNSTNDLYMFSRSILKRNSILEFDKVYNECHNIDTIYNENLKDAVNSLFLGRSACCILFGVSDGGKSYTLRGESNQNSKNGGILGKAITDIFNLVDLSKQANLLSNKTIRLNKNETYYGVRMSVYQVYLDQINDLLGRDYTIPLKIEQFNDNDNNLNSRLLGLTQKEVRHKQDYDSFLKEAIHQRKALAQSLRVNEMKRKSHLVISFFIEKRERTNDGLNNKANEQIYHDFAQLDFVELASSNFGLLSHGIPEKDTFTHNPEMETNNIFYRNTSKTFNSICNNIVCASGGDKTPKVESKLTLSLKRTLRPGNQIFFITCVIPWDNPPVQSHKALKFSNWLRNQVSNIQENKEYKLKSTYEDSENNDEPEVLTPTRKTWKINDIGEENNNKEHQRNSCLSNGNRYEPQDGYSSNDENQTQALKEKMKHKIKSLNEVIEKDKKIKVKKSFLSMSNNSSFKDLYNKSNNFRSSSLVNIVAKENENQSFSPQRGTTPQQLEGYLKDVEMKSLELSKFIDSIKQGSRAGESQSKFASAKERVCSMSDNDNEKLKQKNATLQSDNIIFNEDINRLKGLNCHLEQELKNEKEKNLEIVREKQRLLQENSQIKSELEKLNESKAKPCLDYSISDQFNHRLYYDNKIRDMEIENKKLSEEKQKFEVDFKVLQEKHMVLQRTYETSQNENNYIIKKQEEEVLTIEQRLDLMAKEIERLQKENNCLRMNEERLRQELSNLVRQKDKFQGKYQSHKQKNVLLQKNITEIQEEFNKLIQDKKIEENIIQKEYEKKNIKLDSKQKIVGELQSRIAIYRTELMKQRKNKNEDS